MLHLDLKLDNVLLDENYRVREGDWDGSVCVCVCMCVIVCVTVVKQVNEVEAL